MEAINDYTKRNDKLELKVFLDFPEFCQQHNVIIFPDLVIQNPPI